MNFLQICDRRYLPVACNVYVYCITENVASKSSRMLTRAELPFLRGPKQSSPEKKSVSSYKLDSSSSNDESFQQKVLVPHTQVARKVPRAQGTSKHVSHTQQAKKHVSQTVKNHVSETVNKHVPHTQEVENGIPEKHVPPTQTAEKHAPHTQMAKKHMPVFELLSSSDPSSQSEQSQRSQEQLAGDGRSRRSHRDTPAPASFIQKIKSPTRKSARASQICNSQGSRQSNDSQKSTVSQSSEAPSYIIEDPSPEMNSATHNNLSPCTRCEAFFCIC